MSQENVEIVRRMYEAFHSGDADGPLAQTPTARWPISTQTWS
jgi:hypothetical protein